LSKKYNYSSDWIEKHEDLRHWIFYWNQIRILHSKLSPGDHVLEIGVGTRFTSNYLKSKGYKVTTIDIDAAKKPDIVANIVEFVFTESYDYVIAFEVFEHIPFEDFTSVLKKIYPICREQLIISLPRNEKTWLDVKIELPGSKKMNVRIATKRNKILSKHHHWEVDFAQYSNAYIAKVFRENGFDLEKLEKVNNLFYYTLKKI